MERYGAHLQCGHRDCLGGEARSFRLPSNRVGFSDEGEARSFRLPSNRNPANQILAQSLYWGLHSRVHSEETLSMTNLSNTPLHDGGWEQ